MPNPYKDSKGRFSTASKVEEENIFHRWKAELDFAKDDKDYKTWLESCRKISKRYRDKRENAWDDATRRFNILWSNVQTLKPALYGKQPIPIVERRFMDRDPVARTASTLLERTLSFQLEVGYYNSAIEKAVLDYLLSALGQVWLRYEPQIETSIEEYENDKVQSEEKADDTKEEGDGEPYETLAYEKVCVDYVYYKDFLWSPARCWENVRWVGRCSYLSKSQIKERFGDEKAAGITLDYNPVEKQGEGYDDKTLGYFKQAEVWEIWNKADRKVYFIAPGSALVLEVVDDPLRLEGFWPCPKPLFATQTNDTLIPVPDYVEYQDQARELDDLTDRISRLTTAIKAAGVYDASYKELGRLLQEGMDNKLIPVDSWAAFAEKGGIPGAISLIPMKELIEVLIRLYEARAQTKNDLYEIMGISDIVRGSSEGTTKTATEQRIKGQFASLRLEDRRGAVARFCRDTICIIAEMVSELFSDESLMQMSGYEQIMSDKVRDAVESMPPPPPNSPPEAMQQFQAAQQQAMQKAQQEAAAEFQQAVQILRSDKLRGFRVDIETDSTIQVDATMDKQAATELITSTFNGLAQAGEIMTQAPELAKPIGDLLLFVYRRFRVGRTLEVGLETAIDQITRRLEGPQPPSPEVQKQQLETERAQMELDFEKQSKALDFDFKQKDHAMKLQQMDADISFNAKKNELRMQEVMINERKNGQTDIHPS